MPPKRAPASSSAPTRAAHRTHKFTPRPPLPLEQRLQRLHRSLVDQINEGYLDNAVKTCKKIESLDPTSETASATHLFLLLQLDRYADALALLTSSPADKDFERAYCLYRLHREQEALDALASLRAGLSADELDLAKEDGMGRRLTCLEAQIRYRIGDYEPAVDLFTSLQSTCPSDSPEHADLEHNILAARHNLSFTSTTYASYLPPAPSSVESAVPSLPSRANAAASSSTSKVLMPSGSKVTQDTAPGSSAAAVAAASDVKGKGKARPRHRLPKGAVMGAKFEEDPDRWLPLKQRASYLSSLTTSGGRRRKGAAKKEGMGTGMTQGSADGGGGGSGSSTPVVGGGGRGGKKGRKGR